LVFYCIVLLYFILFVKGIKKSHKKIKIPQKNKKSWGNLKTLKKGLKMILSISKSYSKNIMARVFLNGKIKISPEKQNILIFSNKTCVLKITKGINFCMQQVCMN
jgi:hypothetical protein